MFGRPKPIIDRNRRLLLRAALGQGAQAADAYRIWRKGTRLDDIDVAAYRVLPLLLETSEKYGPRDEDTRRMRGIAKHVWLSNQLRLRSLSAALAALSHAGVGALLLKGAALFARDEQLAAASVTEDYDLLVRRSDAARAVAALIAAGFATHFGICTDRFTEADFETIHAAHFVKDSPRIGSLDLHWRPLPRLNDRAYVEEFLNAEQATLAGRSVAIASLTDHLFLAVARPEPWETNETFSRAVEAIQILCTGNAKIDGSGSSISSTASDSAPLRRACFAS
jgi:hypothetical protein